MNQCKDQITKIDVSLFLYRTYADKLSPKVVQSLLDLLCSQLKNLLSQAGVNLLSSAKDQEDNKHEESSDSEKKDFRGDKEMSLSFNGKDLFVSFSDIFLVYAKTHSMLFVAIIALV